MHSPSIPDVCYLSLLTLLQARSTVMQSPLCQQHPLSDPKGAITHQPRAGGQICHQKYTFFLFTAYSRAQKTQLSPVVSQAQKLDDEVQQEAEEHAAIIEDKHSSLLHTVKCHPLLQL